MSQEVAAASAQEVTECNKTYAVLVSLRLNFIIRNGAFL